MLLLWYTEEGFSSDLILIKFLTTILHEIYDYAPMTIRCSTAIFSLVSGSSHFDPVVYVVVLQNENYSLMKIPK